MDLSPDINRCFSINFSPGDHVAYSNSPRWSCLFHFTAVLDIDRFQDAKKKPVRSSSPNGNRKRGT